MGPVDNMRCMSPNYSSLEPPSGCKNWRGGCRPSYRAQCRCGSFCAVPVHPTKQTISEPIGTPHLRDGEIPAQQQRGRQPFLLLAKSMQPNAELPAGRAEILLIGRQR